MIAIPDRLRSLLAQLGAYGVRQPAMRVERDRWRVAAGAHAALLEAIPDRLDRENGRAFVRACPQSEQGALTGFIASQIWGLGTNGYGPHRLGQALAYPGLGKVLRQVRGRLDDADPVGAFRTLCVINEIPHVGMAFGSKFLHFADPHGRALILDSLLREWSAEHAGIRLRGGRDECEYAMWLLIAQQWATAMKITGEQLELIMFTDALPSDSVWRPKTNGEHEQRPARLRPRTRVRTHSQSTPHVILLGCVKRKDAHRAPAKDLYVSPLWHGEAHVCGSRRRPVVDP